MGRRHGATREAPVAELSLVFADLAFQLDRRDQYAIVPRVMARLLAAAPDRAVRNGARAIDLVDALLLQEKTVSLGETTAMALAEVGRYQEAAAVQRQVITAATDARLTIDRRTMRERLALYVSGRPCRVPFTDGDRFYNPPPPARGSLRASLPQRGSPPAETLAE